MRVLFKVGVSILRREQLGLFVMEWGCEALETHKLETNTLAVMCVMR